jgi:hypothetical protein
MKLFKKFPYLLLAIIIIVGAIYFYSRPTHEGFQSLAITHLAWYWWVLIIFVFLFFLYLAYVSTMSQAYALRTGVGGIASGINKGLTGWGQGQANQGRAAVLKAQAQRRENNEFVGGSRKSRK